MNRLCFAILALTGIVLITSCSTTYQIQKQLRIDNKDNNYFKGFVLYDPVSQKELINYNGSKYFTPASNTKLYTFYTAYKTLGDSIKGLEYLKKGDSLIIRGTADPSLFYGFDSSKVVDLLTKDTAKVYLVDATINDSVYGSGWAWDDYIYDYQPEKSRFPIYGNLLHYTLDNHQVIANPNYFKDSITPIDSLKIRRALSHNRFFISNKSRDTAVVPFITSNVLVADLLGNNTGKKITVIPDSDHYAYKAVYSVPADSLYKQMLVVSDNFIAEQLMLQVANTTSGKYSVGEGIDYSLKKYLADLPQPPRWVDGSGLSRYNLFTPEDMVVLLNKMYREIPREKFFAYFPVGGESGTLKNWYGAEKPFVYAKSGTLSNNYNLSGYLITKSGKVLIFSAMNNHYREPLRVVKKDLEDILFKIYNNF